MSHSASQIDHGQCPICLDSMSKDGEHQISSLPCGHLFGYNCIKRWLEDENQQICPTCRKHATCNMIRLIIWDGTIPLDTMRSEEIKEEHSKAMKKRQTLLQTLTRLERDYNICQSEIATKRSSIFGRSRSPRLMKSIVKKPVSFPSLLFERKICCGFRVSLTSKHLFVSCQKENSVDDFGIEFCERDGSSNTFSFKYISLHSAQIYDLAPSPFDKEAVATVSMDKKLIVTAMRSELPIMEASLPVPLWSCCWISPNTIAVGGTNGRFFIIDGRGKIQKEFELCKGPPILSIETFTDNIMIVSSPLKTSLFDLSKYEFINDPKADLGMGSHALKVAKVAASPINSLNAAKAKASINNEEQHFIMINRLRNNKAVYCLGSKSSSLNHSNTISITRTMNLDKFEKISRPDIITLPTSSISTNTNDTKDIFVIPDEKSFGFKLFSSTNTNFDHWSKWKKSFTNSSFPSPILDISLHKETDLCMAAVSSELLRVYSFPF